MKGSRINLKFFLKELSAPDFQSLSLFRILLGIFLLWDFIFSLHPDFIIFFTNNGILPLTTASHFSLGARVFAPVYAFDAPWLLALFQTVYVTAIVCFIVGFRTKFANWVLFFCTIVMHYRNPLILSGAESLIRLFLLWTLFLPLNRYWSVDAALRLLPRDTPVPMLFRVGIKLQLVFLYVFSGMYKLLGTAWLVGVAPALAMMDGVYGTPLGTALAHQFSSAIPVVSVGVIAFQLAFPLLVYSPWYNVYTRSVALVGAALLHISFIFLLEIGLFPYLCIAYLALIVPDRWWDTLFARRRARLEQISIYFEPGCSFCEKIARILREFCLSPYTPIHPADIDPHMLALLQRHQSWLVVDKKTGIIWTKWEAVAFVLRQNPLTWVFGFLTDVFICKKIFAWLYDYIGRNRPHLSAATRIFFPFKTTERAPRTAVIYLCGTLIVLAFFSNALYFPPVRKEIQPPQALGKLINFTQTRQTWDLFAPTPSHFTYSYEIVGITRAIQEIDLRMLFEQGAMYPLPEGRLEFASHRWLKYFRRLFEQENKRALASALLRLCNGELISISATLTKTPLFVEGESGKSIRVHENVHCVNQNQ